jgi:hypothetical protein
MPAIISIVQGHYPNSGIKTLFNWLFKRRRWKRIKKLEIVTKQLKLDSDESYQSGKPI